MAREQRRTQVECDDGSTFNSKHGSRGAINTPAGLSMFKPKKSGTHTLDIIPFVTTENRDRFIEKMRFSRKQGVYFPHRIYRCHYGVGVNNDAVACSAMNFGKPCPICQQAAIYREKADAESEQKAKDLFPKERSLFLVYDRDETDKGVQLWEVAWYNFGRHISDYIDGAPKSEQASLRVYYHPTNGFTIRINCKETPAGKGKPYTDFLVHSMAPRTSPVPEELLDHGYDLDAMIQELSYDRLKALFTGQEEGDDDDQDDNDNRPSSPSSRNGREDDDEPTPSPRGFRNAPPPPPPAPKKQEYIFATHDRVSLEFKGEEVEGEVVKVDLDNKMASVKIEGRDNPIRVDFSDLTLLEADSTFDRKDSGNKPGWPEDEDRSFQKKPAPEANDDAGDDPTPPKRKKK